MCGLALALGSGSCDRGAEQAGQPGAEREHSSSSTQIARELEPAPDVELVLQSGQRQRLRELRGKPVVLYFYPQDATRGCTIQARGVRDEYESFAARGAVVYGVSLQDAASHRAFIEQEGLPFDLVVDADRAVSRAFGVEIEGAHTARDTILIDAQGIVRKIWRGVSPSDHAELVLSELGKL